MTDAVPPGPTGPSAAEESPPPGLSDAAAPRRRPRKIFVLVGLVLAVGLGIGLFSGIGTSQSTTGTPRVGGPVPSFTAANAGPTGSSQVSCAS